jgi:hypothetical protein
VALFRRPKGSPIKPPPPPPPELHAGDRVRLKTTGAFGTVRRVHGRSVVLEMDDAFVAGGLRQTTYYSYPGELEVVPVVGRMGADPLYAEDGDSAG